MARHLNPVELDRYTVLPRALASRVRLSVVPILPPRADAMTIGRRILVLTDDPAQRNGARALIAHELVHVRQWHDLGRVRFVFRYLSAYLTNLVRLRNHHEAYLAIPLEIEARKVADEWRRAIPGSDRV